MALTRKGDELLDILGTRQEADAEASRAARSMAAIAWAQERVVQLETMCRTTAFGTQMTIIGFDTRTFEPDSEDGLRLAALQQELGVTFGHTRIRPGIYADQGDYKYEISMDPSEFLEFLRRHRQPS